MHFATLFDIFQNFIVRDQITESRAEPKE